MVHLAGVGKTVTLSIDYLNEGPQLHEISLSFKILTDLKITSICIQTLLHLSGAPCTSF